MQSLTGQTQIKHPHTGLLNITETERALGERLLKLAPEIDRFEGYTRPHAVEVARLAERLGLAAGLHGADLAALKFAALAHDLGERTMKRNYLLRPDALTWEETLDLWRHPIIGEQQAVELKLPRQAQLLIRWHHEWWNGRGYPDGLTGMAIPVGARILRAADTYCALISDRPYRAAFDPLDAEQMIADQAGLEFDPSIAKLLLLLLADDQQQQEAQTFAPPLSEPAREVAPSLAAEMMPEETEALTLIAGPEVPEAMEAVPPPLATDADFAPPAELGIDQSPIAETALVDDVRDSPAAFPINSPAQPESNPEETEETR